MIAYDMGPGRFNFRSAGIISREGYILIHRAVSDAFWALPGGRVEWGESTAEALAREIEEELGVAGQVGGLSIVVENFFTYAGKRYHELAYYFPVSLPETFPFRTDGVICHRVEDGDVELEFKWVKPDAPVLKAHDFKPEALRDQLAAPHRPVRHLVWTD